MNKRTKAIVGMTIAGAGAAVAIGGVVAATGVTDDGNEVPITGEALKRASAVALDHLGEGRVTETEEGDEDSYYEVEITLDNGNEVDVQLDKDFNVVGSEADGTGANDD